MGEGGEEEDMARLAWQLSHIARHPCWGCINPGHGAPGPRDSGIHRRANQDAQSGARLLCCAMAWQPIRTRGLNTGPLPSGWLWIFTPLPQLNLSVGTPTKPTQAPKSPPPQPSAPQPPNHPPESSGSKGDRLEKQVYQ